MAQGNNEHRMVFDIRGRRRHVVKFVYAILAILMVASLFLVTGAININSIFGSSTTGESATSSLEKQAVKIEEKIAKEPENTDLLANLTRTRISVANLMINSGAGESTQGVEEVKQQLAKASEDWIEYTEATSEPSPGLAVQAAPALFQLAELSSTTEEAAENVLIATEAQEIVAEARPSIGSLSQLSYYLLFTQNYKAAAKAKEETVALMNTKFERETFENRYEEVEKNAKSFGQGLESEKAEKSKSAGKEALENPLGGLSGGGTGLSAE
jgi:biopolymer transport protein ExbB/TolQ